MPILKDLAQLVNGNIIGDENILINDVTSLEDAKEGDISFVANPKYLPLVHKTRASAVMVSSHIDNLNLAQVVVKDPYLAFARLVAKFHPIIQPEWGIDGRAVIGKSTQLGKDVHLSPMCFIDNNVVIGNRVHIYPHVYVGAGSIINDDTVLYANVSIYSNTIIGKRCIIHSGAVIGADGFGFAKDGLKNVKVPQIGHVEIGDDVEIGANTTIDRAALGTTKIGSGTKIDNLVQIAHNVQIGENSLIVSQVGISGSTQIGSNVIIAGQVGIIGHLKIGDYVQIGAQSGVAKDLPARATVSGTPAFEHMEWLKAVSVFKELPILKRLINELKKESDNMKEKEVHKDEA